MKSKDRIIIQKIISYISDIEEYVKGLEANMCFYRFANRRTCKWTFRRNNGRI